MSLYFQTYLYDKMTLRCFIILVPCVSPLNFLCLRSMVLAPRKRKRKEASQKETEKIESNWRILVCTQTHKGGGAAWISQYNCLYIVVVSLVIDIIHLISSILKKFLFESPAAARRQITLKVSSCRRLLKLLLKSQGLSRHKTSTVISSLDVVDDSASSHFGH
jgi:hypothetical protein